MKLNSVKTLKKQAGMTLIELVAALGVSALVIGGALAMYSAASSSQTSNQLTSDVVALRTATRALHATTGNYGAASLNGVLVSSKKVPSSMYSTGTTIQHGTNGGTVVVTGATTNFTITLTAVPQDVCISMLPQVTGFVSVKVDALAAVTAFPISPATALTNCAAAGGSTIIFTSN